LLLAVGVWRQSDPSRQAFGMVQQCLQWTAEAGVRQYSVTAIVHLPVVGRTEGMAELYVDGAQRFAFRRPTVPPLGDVWVGGNEREEWIVLPQGPILIVNEKMLQNWIIDNEDFPTPYLQVTTVLHRMSQHYDLEILPDTYLELPGQLDQKVHCRRVRGVLRDSIWSRPSTIDLWTDLDDGTVRRLILDWQLKPGEFGRSKVSIDFVGHKELPPDWFEHSAHHGDGRLVLRMPP
ncbi:hypothetical protein ACFL2H_10775, partial [Planctomycetota bacterium]